MSGINAPRAPSRAQMVREVVEGVVIAGMVIFCAFLLAFLSGCAALASQPDPNLQRGVYTAEAGFEAALKVAVAYENLPTCSATQKFPCSDPVAITKITASARAARASLSTAEAAVRSNAPLASAAMQAQADVASFTTLVQVLAK